jgi:hypothetical protein
MDQNTRTIEINGVKMEIDLRHAKVARIDTLKIGTKVKILQKEYSNYAVRHGVVVGFEPFEKLPTIRMAWVDPNSYSSDPMKFISFNSETKDTEILIDEDDDEMSLTLDKTVASFNRAIENKRIELEKLHEAKEIFFKHFGRFFVQQSEVSFNPV